VGKKCIKNKDFTSPHRKKNLLQVYFGFVLTTQTRNTMNSYFITPCAILLTLAINSSAWAQPKSDNSLPRSTPEAQGVSSAIIQAFIEAAVIAEGLACWAVCAGLESA
jgi:hypothetical protein